MADITISYKGATIAEVSSSGTTTLETAGKYCEDDISLAYVKSGGSSYVNLGETDLTVSTTNTSAVSAGSFYVDVPADLWTSSKIIFVSIRDKAGKRAGYFYGADAWFVNAHPINASGSTAYSTPARYRYTYSSAGVWTASNSVTAYGLYAYDINTSGRVRIYSRYSASDSLTINGTYHVEVYALSWPDSSPLT